MLLKRASGILAVMARIYLCWWPGAAWCLQDQPAAHSSVRMLEGRSEQSVVRKKSQLCVCKLLSLFTHKHCSALLRQLSHYGAAVLWVQRCCLAQPQWHRRGLFLLLLLQLTWFWNREHSSRVGCQTGRPRNLCIWVQPYSKPDLLNDSGWFLWCLLLLS